MEKYGINKQMIYFALAAAVIYLVYMNRALIFKKS
jgi:hypothetical protein